MHPFLMIMTLLLVFSFFTTAELKRYLQGAYTEKSFSAIQEKRGRLERLKKMAELQNLKTASPDKSDYIVEKKKERKPVEKKTPKKRSYKLNFDITRPPNNSRLNLRPFLVEEDKKQEALFQSLLSHLYANAPFAAQIPNFDKIITERLVLEKEQFKDVSVADAISSLSFDDHKMREAYYWMLKGKDSYPSLLDFVTFDKKTTRNSVKINLLFAPKELIEVIFNHTQTAAKILEMRKTILTQIVLPETTLTREQIQDYLKEKFVFILMEDNIPSEEYKKFFDFTLGKPGSIAYIEDPLTKKITRERLFN